MASFTYVSGSVTNRIEGVGLETENRFGGEKP